MKVSEHSASKTDVYSFYELFIAQDFKIRWLNTLYNLRLFSFWNEFLVDIVFFCRKTKTDPPPPEKILCTPLHWL